MKIYNNIINLGLLSILMLTACDKQQVKEESQEESCELTLEARINPIHVVNLDENLRGLTLQHKKYPKTNEEKRRRTTPGHREGMNFLLTNLNLDNFINYRYVGGENGVTEEKINKFNPRWWIQFPRQTPISAAPTTKMSTLAAAREHENAFGLAGDKVIFKWNKPTNNYPSTSDGYIVCSITGDAGEGRTTGTMTEAVSASHNGENTRLYFCEKFGRMHYSSPNRRLTALSVDEQEIRHMPLVTDLCRITEPMTSTKAALKNMVFNLRGSVIGIRLKNKLGKVVKVKALEVVNKSHTPFYYGGYFDLRLKQDNPTATTIQTPFVGLEDKLGNNDTNVTITDTSFPIYASADATDVGYDLPVGDVNDSSKVLYVWGYQRENRKGEPFVFKVKYEVDGTELTSTPVAVKIDSEGFKDGTLYYVTLPVMKRPANLENHVIVNQYEDGGLLGPSQNAPDDKTYVEPQ